MQSPWHQFLHATLDRRPNVGRLVELCEHNYALLQRLMPELREMRGAYAAALPEHADLHLDVLEHSRYTSLIHLTYYFAHPKGRQPEPDATLRVYHDARELEVVELRQANTVLSATPLYEEPGLANKWELNWFVNKWLAYCVAAGYEFGPPVQASVDGVVLNVPG